MRQNGNKVLDLVNRPRRHVQNKEKNSKLKYESI